MKEKTERTRQIGVRFIVPALNYIKEKEKLDTPQKVVNFLLASYPEKEAINVSFEELKVKFDELVKEHGELQKKVVFVEEENGRFKLSDGRTGNLKWSEAENKPIAAPEKEKAIIAAKTRKRNEAGALEAANKEVDEALGKPEIDNTEIERQIAAIKAEKIPAERNTSSVARRVWENDQHKKIAELKKLLK